MTWFKHIVPGKQPYYADDAVVIYHANCFDIMPLIKSGVDLVITDPDYNGRDIGVNHKKYINGMPNQQRSEYKKWCSRWHKSVDKISHRIVFTCGIGNLWCYPEARWVLAWHKPAAVSYSHLGGFNTWEPILVYGEGFPQIKQDVYSAPPNNSLTGGIESEHPCPKNISLWQWLLNSVSRPNEVILDIFAGSGTTGRVAKNLGRKAILVEHIEQYCEIAARRMAQTVMPLEV